MKESEIGKTRNAHGEVNNVCRFLNGRHSGNTLKDNLEKSTGEEDIEIKLRNENCFEFLFILLNDGLIFKDRKEQQFVSLGDL